MSAREGQQQPGPRRCAGCDHFHGGRAFGVCLMAGCDCVVVEAFPAAPQLRLRVPGEPVLFSRRIRFRFERRLTSGPEALELRLPRKDRR